MADDEPLVRVPHPQPGHLLLALGPQPLHQLLHVRQAPVAKAAHGGAVFRALVHGAAVDGGAGLGDGDLPVHVAPLQRADLAAAQAQVARQLHHRLQGGAGDQLKEPGHGAAVVEVVGGMGGGGRKDPLGRIAGEELLPPGVLQGVVEQAVVLAHRVAAQPLLLLLVEVALDLGGGQPVQRHRPQSRGQVVADNHVVAVDGAGAAAGRDDLLQPVGQPLAHGQAPFPALLQDAAAVEAVQGLDGLLQGGIAAHGPFRRAAAPGPCAHGDVVAAALGVVGDVGHDGLSGHNRYLPCFFRQICQILPF